MVVSPLVPGSFTYAMPLSSRTVGSGSNAVLLESPKAARMERQVVSYIQRHAGPRDTLFVDSTHPAGATLLIVEWPRKQRAIRRHLKTLQRLLARGHGGRGAGGEIERRRDQPQEQGLITQANKFP